MVDEPVKKNRHGKSPIDSAIQAHIGQQLRAMYDETAAEPVPADILRLLDALSAAKAEAEGAPADTKPSGRKASESA